MCSFQDIKEISYFNIAYQHWQIPEQIDFARKRHIPQKACKSNFSY